MLKKHTKIFLAGHRGLLGSSLLRMFKKYNYKNIITADKKKLDLRNQSKVFNFLKFHKPQIVINCAGKVGGIKANLMQSGEFIYDNLSMQTNLIHGSYLNKVNRFIFMGSSCIYPKFAKQPIKEKYLLDSPLEKTNESYAIAKIAGLKLCESYNKQYNTNYLCLMPSNLYGPNDSYDEENSHFFAAIIKKLYNAKKNNLKKVVFWGTGKVKREITYVDEVSEACLFFLKKKTKHSLINVGSGYEKTIGSFVKLISTKLKVNSKIIFNNDKFLDGTPRKIVDTTLARSYGWKPRYNFDKSFEITLQNYINNLNEK